MDMAKDDNSCLTDAAINGQIDVVRWLVEHGADINHANNVGTSVCMSVSSAREY